MVSLDRRVIKETKENLLMLEDIRKVKREKRVLMVYKESKDQ